MECILHYLIFFQSFMETITHKNVDLIYKITFITMHAQIIIINTGKTNWEIVCTMWPRLRSLLCQVQTIIINTSKTTREMYTSSMIMWSIYMKGKQSFLLSKIYLYQIYNERGQWPDKNVIIILYYRNRVINR